MSPRKLLSLSAFSAVLLGACTSGGESLNVVTPLLSAIWFLSYRDCTVLGARVRTLQP